MERADGRRQEPLGAKDVRAFSLVSGAGRLAIGLGLMIAPRRALGLLGFEDSGESAVVIARIAGVRDMVLAGTTLLSLEDQGRLRSASIANAVADAGDALTFALSLRRGGPREACLLGIAAALPASATSAWMAWRLR